MNNTKRAIGLIPILGWPILGCKRGLNSYDYNHSNNKLYRSSRNLSGPFYIDKMCWGVAGILIYLNPVSFLFVLYKEVYRLEINLRGIEDEKKSEYYNEIL
jgi:hypothetical protein